VLRLGTASLVIFDKDADRAKALALRLNEHLPGGRATSSTDLGAALAGASGLIQATPMGMDQMPGTPVPEELLRPSMWVSEIVYRPLETELLRTARRIGCATLDGGHMNVGQALYAFKSHGAGRRSREDDANFRRPVT
jgi:shikimate dehydrogenase